MSPERVSPADPAFGQEALSMRRHTPRKRQPRHARLECQPLEGRYTSSETLSFLLAGIGLDLFARSDRAAAAERDDRPAARAKPADLGLKNRADAAALFPEPIRLVAAPESRDARRARRADPPAPTQAPASDPGDVLADWAGEGGDISPLASVGGAPGSAAGAHGDAAGGSFVTFVGGATAGAAHAAPAAPAAADRAAADAGVMVAPSPGGSGSAAQGVRRPPAGGGAHPLTGSLLLTPLVQTIERGGTANFRFWFAGLPDITWPHTFWWLRIGFGDGNFDASQATTPSGYVDFAHTYPVSAATDYTVQAWAEYPDPGPSNSNHYSNEVSVHVLDAPTLTDPPPADGGDPGYPPCECTDDTPGSPVPDPSSEGPSEGADPVDDNPAYAPSPSSEAPVRYADGVIHYRMVDLASDGFGTPWTQSRSWTNGTGYAGDSLNGVGTVDSQMPHLADLGGGRSRRSATA
jgi:hypothetical protein